MTDLAVPDGIFERESDVVLTEDFLEALWSEPPVERLVAGVDEFRCLGHGASLRRACDMRVTIRPVIADDDEMGNAAVDSAAGAAARSPAAPRTIR